MNGAREWKRVKLHCSQQRTDHEAVSKRWEWKIDYTEANFKFRTWFVRVLVEVDSFRFISVFFSLKTFFQLQLSSLSSNKKHYYISHRLGRNGIQFELEVFFCVLHYHDSPSLLKLSKISLSVCSQLISFFSPPRPALRIPDKCARDFVHIEQTKQKKVLLFQFHSDAATRTARISIRSERESLSGCSDEIRKWNMRRSGEMAVKTAKTFSTLHTTSLSSLSV